MMAHPTKAGQSNAALPVFHFNEHQKPLRPPHILMGEVIVVYAFQIRYFAHYMYLIMYSECIVGVLSAAAAEEEAEFLQ